MLYTKGPQQLAVEGGLAPPLNELTARRATLTLHHKNWRP